MKKQTTRKFYTLVEIMTVIVIAAILFGIAIPAFTSMIQGSNMTVAIRQLSAKLQAARAYAVTNRCRVAVLLVTTQAKEDYCHSVYRVCVVDSSDAFQEWIEDENWKTLPKGILRDSVTIGAGALPNISIDASDIGGGSGASVPAVIFRENGQLTSGGAVTVSFCQGRYVDSNIIYTERNTDGKYILHPIEINPYSGKVAVKDIQEKSIAPVEP